ncbi:UDP-N-acetylglucosamine 2-epimerase [Candidatus Pelagibacter sp.]|nr:UDP-N-acetylglucosamine 2-epimerase [Candidatus Pelagibacter sp.]
MIKKKICIVINNRANYARIKTLLKAIKKHKKLQLQLILESSAILTRYGSVDRIIKKDGFKIDEMIYTVIEGENPSTMSKSAGLAVIELTTIFGKLKPDIVLTIADRYETLPIAMVATYMNIPLAHTQGGEVTGSIDESVRHATTKLAHIHFPATKKSAINLLKLGEDPKNIHMTGCPSIDLIKGLDLSINQKFINKYKIHGVGPNIDISKDYIVVLQHPVTTEYGNGLKQITETINAVKDLDINIIWLWPNVDAGSDSISNGLRTFRESQKLKRIKFYKNFEPEDYLRLMNNSLCIVGNSSSAIREASYLGVPAVNIGTRQQNREHGKNVISVGYNSKKIKKAILSRIKLKKFKRETIYGDGNAGSKIAEILLKTNVKIQKKLNY